jgi:predicted transcriptional regulator
VGRPFASVHPMWLARRCARKFDLRLYFCYASSMKTAISIPDDLFQDAEKLARELELSRSALYSKALREMIERLRDEAITSQINAALKIAPYETDPFVIEAARRRMKREGSDW